MSFIDFFRKKKKKLTDGAKTTLGNLAGEVKNTLKRANQAPEWMKRADMGLSNFSQKAENFPKFEFADKVKNPVGRFVATIPQEIMNIPSRTVRGSLRDYGKVKATPQYLTKRGAEAANIGVDIGSTFAGGGTAKNLIKEGFKQTTKTGLKDVIKTGAKRGFKEGVTYGGASGFFAGAQEGESLRDQGVNALKSGVMGSAVGGGAGFVLGGTMAGGGRIAKNTKDGTKREIMNIGDDIHRFKNPYKKRIVNETKEVPNGAIVDGQPVTMSVHTGKRYIQTIKDPFVPKSITGKILTARPGLNIQDINSAKPKIISSKPIKQSRRVMDFDNKIAQKNQRAAELVNNQKTNQKLNLDKTEEGFVLPKDVKAPEVKNNIGKYELTDDDYRRASDAHSWISFDPEKSGKRTIEETRDFVENTYKELAPIAEKNGTLDNFNAYFERFKANVRKNSDKAISAKSRTASSAITGGSNFNVGRNQKYMDRYENAFRRYMDESDKGVNILKKIANNVQKPVRVGDKDAITKAKSEIERLVEKRDAFKEINKRLRKGENIESVLSSYPDEIAGGHQGAKYYLSNRGVLDGKSIPGFALTGLNSKIKRLQGKATVAEKIQNVEIPENIIPDAITTIDREANRLRISHPQRPDAQVIADMKAMGLRWSPFNKAWQAPVTPRLLYKIKTYSQNLKPEEVKPAVIPKSPIQEEIIKAENPFIQPKKQVVQEEIKAENPFLPEKPKNNPDTIQEAKKYYHGTNANFDAFDINKTSGDIYGPGVSFVSDKSRATKYGKNIKEATLNVKNTLNLNDKVSDDIVSKIKTATGNDYSGFDGQTMLARIQDGKTPSEVRTIFKNAGIDGTEFNLPDGHKIKVVFDTRNIKSPSPKQRVKESPLVVYHDPKKRRLETKGGYLEYSIDKDSNEFIIDYVEATEKRKGVGTKLMNEAEKIAEKEGLDVGLVASPQDDIQKFEDLKDFYESLGYENVAEFGDVAEFSKKNADLLSGEVPIKSQPTDTSNKSNQTIPKPPIKEVSPVIKPEAEVKPKIEENPIKKLKEYQKYKKDTIDTFLKSEDGYKKIAEMEVRAEMQDPVNKDVLSGIRNNPQYRKERQIYDDMGEGFLLEKNGRYLVADAKKAREYEAQGWRRKIEIDSLASASGFERGEDYLNHIIQAGENDQLLVSPRSIARKELLKDPAYAELEREIERLKPLADQIKKEIPPEQKISKVNDTPFFGDEFNPTENPFISKAKSTKELIQDSPFSGNEFNEFQQRAYNAKGERIKKLGEVLNRGNELLRMGYRKSEINKKGIDEIKRIEKLSKLGYPKAEIDKMDFDRMDLIINREVPWTSLKDYYERKHALDTNFLRDIDPQNLKDIAPLMTGGRDAYRNFEKVFGKDYPKIKERLLDPFDEAKGRYIDEQKALLGELNKNIVQKFGITKGSKIDKAVVAFGEGKIGIDELKQKFPKDWKNIVEADKWFRTQYSKLLGDLNMTREAFFPTHPLYPESTKIIPERKDYYRHGQNMEGFGGLKNMFENPSNIDPSVAVMSDVANPKTKWLSFGQRRKGDANELGAVEGYLDYLRNHAYAKHIDPYIQKFKGVDDEAKTELNKGQFFHETIGLAEELAKKMDPIQKITDSQDINKIKDILTANKLSESQADWMAKELAGLDNYQEVKNFIRNKTAKNKENILENMGFKANAEVSENKLNNFLVFIKNYSKDLAGKTNPIDRPFQENFFGRKVFNVIDFANKRFKANAVLGNLSSSLAQFFNIPQGISSAGARNSIKSVGMTLADVFNKKSPISKSNFIKERYFNDYNKFDEGILADTKKMAVWVTGIGDKIGTKFIWNAHYQKALSQGLDNPVKYANDWTRKMVAGRGIGEVPLAQKSRIIQVVAPFQLEVANMWFALKDIAGDNPQKLTLAKKMIEFTVASFLMNRAVKEIRGSDVSFDPINAMLEAMNEYQEEDDKTTGAIKAGGRMVGEVVSNIPGGQTLASMYPEYGWRIGAKGEDGERKKIPRKELFGEGDPTRFGTGGLPMYSAFKNPQNILTTLVTPFGGKQIEKTIGGAKTLMDGYAESGAGQVMTPVNRDLTNIMQGLMFGKNAMGAVRDYYNNEDRPLSDLQGEKFKMMGNDREYFNSIKADREANKEKEELKKNKSTEKAGQISDDVYQLSNGKYYVKSLDKDFATPEKAQKELLKEEFKNSDKNFVDLGDTVLRKTESGAVSEINKNKFNSMLYTAQLGLYKKNKDVGKWMETAEKQIEALNNSLIDPNIDELEKVEIESKMETLLNEYEKYQGYGGFTKPKVAKKLEEKWKYPVVNMDFMKIKNMLNDLNYKRQIGSRKTFFIPRKRVSKVSRRK